MPSIRRDIQADSQVIDELIRRGGDSQLRTTADGTQVYFDPLSFNAPTLGLAGMFANFTMAHKFRVPVPMQATQMLICCGTAGADLVDLAIARKDSSGLVKIAGLAAPIATVAQSLIAGTFTAPVTLLPGTDYWGEVAINNSAGQFLRGQNAFPNLAAAAEEDCLAKTVGGYPIPTVLTGYQGHANFFWFRIKGNLV
jgi:hypothetical protein